MIRTLLVTALLTASVLTGSCVSSSPVKKPPEHLDRGEKNMRSGISYYQKGCYGKALDFFLAAHENFSASDQVCGVARSLNSIANVYRHADDIKSALLFSNEAIAAGRLCNTGRELVQALANKAAILIDAEQFDAAGTLLTEALSLARSHGVNPAIILNSQGILLMKRKDFAAAEEKIESALKITPTTDLTAFATVQFTFGNLMMETAREKEAEAYFKNALDADRQAGFFRGVADDLAALGLAYEKMGKPEKAVSHYKRSVKIYALFNDRKKSLELLERMETLAKSTDMDIRIAIHFVKTWLEDNTIEKICE